MFIPGKEYLPFAVIAPEAKYGKDFTTVCACT